MKNKGLTIATLVLAALLGALYWSNRNPPSDDTNVAAPTPSEPAPNILTLNEADLTKIELNKAEADQLVIVKDSNGKWQISAPKAMRADDAAVSTMVSTLSSLNADRLVEEKATNLDRYGLSRPRLEISITDKNNTTHKLLLGDDTPTSSGAYALRAGDERVFTVASFVKTGLDKGLDDLRDKRLITAEADKITRVELTTKQQTIEFSRDKEQWQILKPQPLRADGSKVDELVRQITDAQMDLTPGATEPESSHLSPEAKEPSPSPDVKRDESTTKKENEAPIESKAASAFASGSVVATARLTTDSGTQQIQVRKHKEEYYAKSSVTEGTFKVANTLGEALDKKLDDFRNKKPFDFGLNDPSKIEIRDGDKIYYLTKGGDDWWSGEGKKYEKAGVDALLSKVRELEATDFTNSGFGSAALQIAVTSSDGKRLDKVSLAKGANNTLARLNGESTLYLVDANVITEIQKLLSELKS